MTLWPNGTRVKPYVTSAFGWRNLDNPNASKFHRGVDMVGFTLVRAVESGQVKVIGTPNGWIGGGIQVWVQHDGFFSRSLHLASYSVRDGQFVREGEVLGVMGRTPNVDLHLHLEISPGTVHYSNSGQIDPVPFLSGRIDGGSSAGGGTDKPVVAPIEEKDEDMIPLYVTDSVDGNDIPGWALLNTRTGKVFPMRANNESWATLEEKQKIANSWGRVWGSAKRVTRLDMLNAIDAIQKTL